MQIEIIKDDKVLRSAHHDGQVFVEAPKKGRYAIRLRNDSPMRRMAIVSVDGINVISGEDAGHQGSGYILHPWETLEIPGWRRNDDKVAAFEFRRTGGATYAEQTGRGAQNTGVIGVAIFDEKIVRRVQAPPLKMTEHHHHHYPWPQHIWSTGYTVPPTYTITTTRGGGFDGVSGGNIPCSTVFMANVSNSVSQEANVSSAGTTVGGSSIDVGTGYGKETAFHTVDASFERATEAPAQVIVVRYATADRLKAWGVTMNAPVPTPRSANPFPASSQSCPPPSGWQG